MLHLIFSAIIILSTMVTTILGSQNSFLLFIALVYSLVGFLCWIIKNNYDGEKEPPTKKEPFHSDELAALLNFCTMFVVFINLF